MNRASGSVLSSVATAAAIFLLYTNLPVVAYQRGLVPKAAAAMVPILLGAAVVHQIIVLRRPIAVDRTLVAMFGFLAVMLLSAFGAKGYDAALDNITIYLSEGLVIYLLIRNAVRTLPELRRAMVAVLFAASLLGSLTVAQEITGAYRQDFMGLAQRNLEPVGGAASPSRHTMGPGNRAKGSVDEPNRFAQILLMVSPLGLVLGMNALRRRQAILAGLSVSLLLGGVLFTYSRGAFVVLVVLIMMCAPLRLIRPQRVAGVLLAGAILTPLIAPGYAERVASIAGAASLFGAGEVEADGATTGRTTSMLAALAAYTDHPVLGVGPGQYAPHYSVHYQALPEISIRERTVPRRAHNLYLEVAAETGTFGLLIFLAIPLLLLRDLEGLRRGLACRRPDLARLAAGFTLGLLAYLGTGMFLHLAFARYYWFLVALSAAAVAVLQKQGLHAADEELRQLAPVAIE